MTSSLKFGLVASVVIAVVVVGYLLSKHKLNVSNKAAAATGDFATKADGTPDYSKKADGTAIPLGSRLLK